jgi:NTP pyrophosphatase (non-canonical NTP hydrolase)
VEITALEQELEKWHEQKYGRSEIDVPKTMRKLGEEFGEFVEAVMGGDSVKISEEATDVMFVMMHIVRHFGGAGALGEASEAKLKEVFYRLYHGKPCYSRLG